MSKFKRVKRIAAEMNVALSSTVLRLNDTEEKLADKIQAWRNEAELHEQEAPKAAVLIADMLLTDKAGEIHALLRRYQQHRGRAKLAREFIKNLEIVGGSVVSVRHAAANAIVPECQL